eukprot:gb/GFBE01073112.1/.p1 GENE.gb/GFBE01073112.1/~~gb/GFBE01073112.1/.p1  ORF type:complete len:1141 (+),score=216.96 gb/GFBE01073112.1/:1-3423(+)
MNSVRQTTSSPPAVSLLRLSALVVCAWPGASRSLSESQQVTGGADALDHEVEFEISPTGKGRMMRAERAHDRVALSLAEEDQSSQEAETGAALGSSTTTIAAVDVNDVVVNKSDCQWYEWSPWSYCSQSCGQNGWRSRKRTVAVERSVTEHCSGSQEELSRCNEFECPIDCVWGMWSDWSHCTASCGGGSRQRGRPIAVQNNTLGEACDFGDGIQIEDCATQVCARDCAWSDWSAWAKCSESCGGGVTTRSRLQQPAVAGGKKCEGASRDEEVCMLRACPKDCVLSDWSSWEPCSASCGNGTTTRHRSLVSDAEGGGMACAAIVHSEDARCFVMACATDCVWADWSEWSWCPVTCGGNETTTVHSTRHRAIPAKSGGKDCIGEDSRQKVCGETSCPIPCEWGTWGDWGTCSKTCGGGLAARFRNVSIPAAHGGSQCMGAVNDTKDCNPELCPLDCKISDWSEWGACSKPCGSGTALRWRYEVSPAARGGEPCPEQLHERGQCSSNDCTPVSDLIRDGAHQVTGYMQLITEDPMTFAGNPFVEEVSRQAISEYAELPVNRVHVSMMPHIFGMPGTSREVNCWFSMLVPNTTDLKAVLNNLRRKDLVQAGKLLRGRLHQAGIRVAVNITKLYLTSENKRPIPLLNDTVPAILNATPNVTTTTEAPGPDWSNPNVTRVTGVMKMIVTQPLAFAEDAKASTASQLVLGEIAGIADAGVHVSLIPDQVYNYAQYEGNLKFGGPMPENLEAMMLQMGAEAPSYPSDSIKNVSGGVDAWFSLVGKVQKDRQTAIQEGRNMAKALMAEDLKEVSHRLRAFLNQTGVGDDEAEVIKIIAKADGDTTDGLQGPQEDEDEPKDEPQGQIVTGVVEMITKQPKVISADHRSEEGLLTALSQLSGLPEEDIRVAIMPSARLAAMGGSLLARPSVENGEVPPRTPVEEDNGYSDEISAWFRIKVPARPEKPDAMERAEKLAAKLRVEDLTLAGLKVQNCFMDLGLDAVVRVGRITAYVYSSTTPSPDGLKKVRDLVPDDLLVTSNEHLDGVSNAMQTVLDSAIVPHEEMTPPSKVVAVVASVGAGDVEPPTLSNPGGGDEEDDDLLGGSMPSLLHEEGKSAARGQPLEPGVRSAAAAQGMAVVVLAFPIFFSYW